MTVLAEAFLENQRGLGLNPNPATLSFVTLGKSLCLFWLSVTLPDKYGLFE